MKTNDLVHWTIEHPLYGRVQLLPTSIRYYKDRWHPYGWEIGCKATVRLPSGETRRDWRLSALGTDRQAAKANMFKRINP